MKYRISKWKHSNNCSIEREISKDKWKFYMLVKDKKEDAEKMAETIINLLHNETRIQTNKEEEQR